MDLPGYAQSEQPHQQLKRYLISEEELNQFPRIKNQIRNQVLNVTLLNGLYYWNFDLAMSLDSFAAFLEAEGLEGLERMKNDNLPIPAAIRVDLGRDTKGFLELLKSKGYNEDEEGQIDAPFELFRTVYNLQAMVAGVPDMAEAADLLDEEAGPFQGLFGQVYNVLAGLNFEVTDEDLYDDE